MVPENLKYTKDHEWIKIDGDIATIGITDHAQNQLGDITFVELPEESVEVASGDTFCTVESVKAASDVYAPIAGEVVAANSDLETTPELINQDPYDKGWICQIKIAEPDEVNNLMDSENYKDIIKG